ncbi:MAG: hypothetical protein LC785_00840 [Acidobacteria bacterium]|nr:hypothetical protein [Acidobacteriota bacterium]MCA1640535.1 hypothetical protein [Acidobacteriota bacterium]
MTNARALGRIARGRRREFVAPRFVVVASSLLLAVCFAAPHALAKGKRRAPAGGRAAVVVDERLSALRDEPRLSAALLRRLGTGRAVALTGARREADGVAFYQVAVTRRTRGWLQSESFAAPARAGDDARLANLIRASRGFDRVERTRVFLDLFPRSALRPEVLLIHGDAAEEAAVALTRAASSRLAVDRLPEGGAPLHSYYLNFNGLDRYRRQGVAFTFDRGTKQFHYDGESWRELARRFPRSPQAAQARRRIESLSGAAVR